MQTAATIRALLEARGLRPKRSLGQNFLVDHAALHKLVEASGVHAGSVVLEVGPGTGVLTDELLARGCRVVACELDDALCDLMLEKSAEPASAGRLSVIRGDCLAGKRTLRPEAVEALEARAGPEGWSLVANLPYGSATPLISTLLIHHPRCRVLAVTVQREVADRLLAGPGSRDLGPLSVLAQALAEVRRVAVLPPGCFWPRPEVESAMVVLHRRSAPRTADPQGLADLAQLLFQARRKTLGSTLNRLVPGLVWPEGVDPGARAESLTVEQFEALRGSARSSGWEA